MTKHHQSRFSLRFHHNTPQMDDMDDTLYLYLISYVTAIFCLMAHIYLLIFFIFEAIPLFIYANVASIAVYCAAIICIVHRQYQVACLVISWEVTFFALLCSYTFGIHNYIIGYFILVIILQAVVPYGKKFLKIGMIAFLCICIAGSICMDAFLSPLIYLSPASNCVFTISNICFLAVGTIVQLFIGNIIKQFIAYSHKAHVDELTTQAHTDILTGLFNRRYAKLYFDMISKMDTHKQYCIAMLDIDDFKLVNDTFGHTYGDKALQFLAIFLKEHLRKTDLIFRWGGEEFLLLLDNVDLFTAHTLLDKIRRLLSSTDIPTDHGPIRITVTIGVSAFAPHAYLDSIAQSDQKLYEGKRMHKNVVVM